MRNKILIILLAIIFMVGCSKDEPISIDYITVEKGEATINYNDLSKQVTASYTVPSGFYSTTDWRNRKIYINQDNVVSREIDDKYNKFKFYSGNMVLWFAK